MDLLGHQAPPRARVLLDDSAGLELDYALPNQFLDQATDKNDPSKDANADLNLLQVGRRVRVPLRGRLRSGTITAIIDPSENLDAQLSSPKGLKQIAHVEPTEQSLTPGLLHLARWVSDYYLCSLDATLKSILPGTLRANDAPLQRQALQLLEPTTDSENEKTEASLDSEDAPLTLKRAPRQRALWQYLKAQKTEGVTAILLTKLAQEGYDRPLTQGLIKRGLAKQVRLEVERDPWQNAEIAPSLPHALNEQQAAALAILEQEQTSPTPKPVLLHGVTGSGKTEIFLQASLNTLNQGKQVLVLVPEIALTPQTIQRFKARFSENQQRVAVLHSHLSAGERADQWRRIRRGEADIVIGARSAIFAPLDNIGLIIVDEEHESAYKQEQAPRYQARDLAVMRAHIEASAVILGSATPSIESWLNVQAGKYRLASLPKRIDSAQLPLIRVLDMKREMKRIEAKGPAIFSEPLRQALQTRFEQGQQAILFLNRRGYSRSLQCPSCGEAVRCKHCEVALTYHRSEEILLCHLCGYRQLIPKHCPSCAELGLAQMGYGTQQVEEVFGKIFPSAKIARLDADSMKRKNALQDTLAQFQAGKLHALIGTQMIAKGLHVPNVTLVGVLNADLGLHAPDLRASERVFQLLVQVSGRAGRGELDGEVIIQSCVPHAPAIQFARHHDVEGFLEEEANWRKIAKHPPFFRMVMLSTRSPKQDLGLFALENLAKRLKRLLPKEVELGIPVTSPLPRAQDLYRAQLILKAPRIKLMTTPLQQVIENTPMPEEVFLSVDVDPYSFW